jgi:uncharacterized protein YndB with AHSA1/START domain
MPAQHISHTVHIDAPPDRVWSTTIDVERWPEWTPTAESIVRSAGGPLTVGEAVTVKQPGLPEATWTVLELEPPRRFLWSTELMGMRLVATHELEPDGDGTRSRLLLEASGAIAAIAWPMVRGRAEASLGTENEALKARCEAPAGTV